MIIYGYRSTQVKHGFLPCPACGSFGSVEAYIFQTYAHIFYIPLFPFMRTGAAQCSQCQQIFKPKEMQGGLKESYNNFKKGAKIPLWTFAGAAIIGALVFIGVRESKAEAANTVKYLNKPAVGDIYEVKTTDTSYTLFKVGLIETDSIFIHPNFYETDRESGLLRLKEKGDSVYDEALYGYSKTELQQMLKKGDLITINR